MKLGNNISVSFKENSATHYILKYVKFKGGPVDVTQASALFKGRINSKNKARISAGLLVKDGCINHVSGDMYRITGKGLEVVQAIGRMNQMGKPELRD